MQQAIKERNPALEIVFLKLYIEDAYFEPAERLLHSFAPL